MSETNIFRSFFRAITLIMIVIGTVFGARPLDIKTIKVERSTSCHNGTTKQSGEYPQLSGLSDAQFQEKINYSIKQWVENFLSVEECGYDTYIGSNVLLNDGENFAVQLRMGYVDCRACEEKEKMITIDVQNNRTVTSKFSKGRHLLYPPSKVTMSVPAINRILSKYENKSEECNISISDKRNGTFVVADGHIAFEIYLDMGCASCMAMIGLHTIPLYKLVSETTTSATITDNRDGKTYRVVTIDGKTWMAENLNYQMDSSWCYENDNSNCNKYGRLYSWNAAKKACPSSWHLPSRQEWKNLIKTVGDSSIVGKKLKARNGWNSNGNGTDDYGFSALPSGFRSHDVGDFRNAGKYGYWWTATEKDHIVMHNLGMGYKEDDVIEGRYYRSGGFSVRCIQGNEEPINAATHTVDSTLVIGTSEEKQNISWRFIYIVITIVVVLAIIIAIFTILKKAEKSKRCEIETKRDVDRAMTVVENTKNKLDDHVSTTKNIMSFDEELSALESAVNEYETEIETGKISADGLVNSICSVGSTDAQIMAKTQDVMAMLQDKIERVSVVKLKKIKDQYPDDPQVDKLVRRAAECYLKLSSIGLLVGEGLMSPDVRSQVHSSNQGVLDGLKNMVDHAISGLPLNGLPPIPRAVRGWFEVFGGAEAGLNNLFSDRGGSHFYRLMVTAVMSGDTEVVNWLFSVRSDMENNINNFKNERGESLLHIAAHKGKPEIIGLMLYHNADIHAKDDGGKTIMFVLAFYGHTEAMKWLVKEKGQEWILHEPDNYGFTPMSRAALVGNVESIECLASLGADVRGGSNEHNSPINCAVGFGQVESIKCLHKLDKDLVKLKTKEGQTPMFYAAMGENPEIIKYLASLGADVDAKDNQDWTPIFKAAQEGKADNIRCLAELGASLKNTDKYGTTPMFPAAESGPETIECLASLGADVNAALINGITPIFVAVNKNLTENIDCLIKYGANINAISEGMTPLDFAIKGNRTEAIECLRKHGAKRLEELQS